MTVRATPGGLGRQDLGGVAAGAEQRDVDALERLGGRLADACSAPSMSMVRPAERADGEQAQLPDRESRSWRIWIIVPPTTPVAPTTATVSGFEFIEGMARLVSGLVGHGGSIPATLGRSEPARDLGRLPALDSRSDRILGGYSDHIGWSAVDPTLDRRPVVHDGPQNAPQMPVRTADGAVPANRRADGGDRGCKEATPTVGSRSATAPRSTCRPAAPGTAAPRPRHAPAPGTRRPAGPRRNRPVVLGRGVGGQARRVENPQTVSLARWRCIAALRERLTRPCRSTSSTTTMISSPTDTTSSTVGTW